VVNLGKKEEIEEIEEILKQNGLDQKERRKWISTLKKEARCRT